MTEGLDPQVLIVGGGPTGLAASILLSRQGVRTLLVERRAGTSSVPRARSVHRRTMEILRTWGLAQTAIDAEYPLRPERVWSRTLDSTPTRREPIVAAEDDSALSAAHMCGCAQDALEPILLGHAQTYPDADLRFSTELTDLDVDGSGVSAALVDHRSGRRSTVRADYLLAADGPNSAVRRQRGIAMRGPGDLARKLNVLIRADLGRWVPDPPPVLHFVEGEGEGGVSGVFVANGHGGRYQFDIDVPAQDTDRIWRADVDRTVCADLVRRAVGVDDLEVEVLGVMPWTVAAQVADRFRDGRVLLAGDAVHRLTPMGGMGVSTGIADVHNLAWKLAAVLDGRAEEHLLDTYEAERRPIALQNVALSLAMFRGERGGETLTEADLGQVYRSASVDREPGTDDGRSGLAHVRPGVRAPHVWLTVRGERVSTTDLFDRHPVLLAGVEGAGWIEAASRVSSRTGWDVRTVLVDEPEWHARYGVDTSGAVLVRPDGYIAWRQVRGTADAEARLFGAVRRLFVVPVPTAEPRSVPVATRR